MRKRLVRFVSLALTSLLVLAACAPAPAPPAPGDTGGDGAAAGEAAGRDITVVVGALIPNIADPTIANSTAMSMMVHHVYDRLVTIDENFNIVGQLAYEWSQPDATTLEFVVRDGFIFHNGDPLTMDDVVFSIERMRDLPQMATFAANLESVESDGNTLRVNMLEPNNGFIRQIANIVIMSQSYLEEVGEDYANNPIGTGPFRVREFVPGTRMVIEAWEDHPFHVPAIDTITFIAIPEPVARYIAIEAGDAHFAPISSSDRYRAAENPEVQLVSQLTTNTSFMAMNASVAPFDNVNVRRAMAHAYNKEGLAGLTPGHVAIDSMFPTMFDTYYSSAYMPTYDLELARQLLEEAGFGPDNPLHFEGWIYSADFQMAMEAFQASLLSIGVQMDIVSMEFGVFLERLAAGESRLLLGGWNNTTGNPMSAFEVYYSGSMGTMNIGFYNNPRADELYNIAVSTISQEELMAAAIEMQNIAAQSVPVFPTHTQTAYHVMVNELQGVEINPTALISFRYAYIAE